MRKPVQKGNLKASGNSWPIVTLGDLISEFRGGFSLETDSDISADDEIGILKVSAVNSGRFFPLEAKRIPSDLIRLAITPVKRDRVIINRSNTPELVGACGYASRNYDNLFLPDTLWQMEPRNPEELDSQWLAYLLSSTPFRQKLSRLASGTSGSMKKLSRGSIETLELPLPPKSYQTKAANILSRWDALILLLERSVIAKEKQKLGLMQRLLTGSLRVGKWKNTTSKRIRDHFGEYPNDWNRCALGVLTEEISVRAGSELEGKRVLSSTKHNGLVPSDEYFGRKVYSDDTSNYKVVKRGDFAYATNHIDEGSIGRQTDFEIGLVSPIYTVFRAKPSTDGNYLHHLIKSSLLLHHYGANTSASVDRRGSLRYSEFARIQVWVPSKAEQTAIAVVLSTASKEIQLLNRLIDAVTKQKQGLMQRLLTGTVRFKTTKGVT